MVRHGRNVSWLEDAGKDTFDLTKDVYIDKNGKYINDRPAPWHPKPQQWAPRPLPQVTHVTVNVGSEKVASIVLKAAIDGMQVAVAGANASVHSYAPPNPSIDYIGPY